MDVLAGLGAAFLLFVGPALHTRDETTTISYARGFVFGIVFVLLLWTAAP